MKRVMWFGKKGKLSSLYLWTYKVIQWFSKVSYELELTQELSMVHLVFHVSMFWKYIGDPYHITYVENIKVTEDLSYE